jgi:hypothetical protein
VAALVVTGMSRLVVARSAPPGFAAALAALGVLLGVGGWALHRGRGPSLRADVLMGASAGCLLGTLTLIVSGC